MLKVQERNNCSGMEITIIPMEMEMKMKMEMEIMHLQCGGSSKLYQGIFRI